MLPLSFVLESQEFPCEYFPGLNILGHAQILELKTGSQCGGHGVCGKDIFRINPEQQKNFLSPPTEVERTILGSKKITEGFRLGCQAFFNQAPSANFEIEIIL